MGLAIYSSLSCKCRPLQHQVTGLCSPVLGRPVWRQESPRLDKHTLAGLQGC